MVNPDVSSTSEIDRIIRSREVSPVPEEYDAPVDSVKRQRRSRNKFSYLASPSIPQERVQEESSVRASPSLRRVRCL